MKTSFKIQVPVALKLKKAVEKKALSNGFDSLQSFTRFLYTKFVNNELNINIMHDKVEYMSPEFELELSKSLAVALQEEKEGKLKNLGDDFFDEKN